MEIKEWFDEGTEDPGRKVNYDRKLESFVESVTINNAKAVAGNVLKDVIGKSVEDVYVAVETFLQNEIEWEDEVDIFGSRTERFQNLDVN